MWQVAPTASAWPWQSCTPLKFPGGAPPAPLTTTDDRPTLVMLAITCNEPVPTLICPKSNPAGVIRNFGGTPLPFMGMLNPTPFQDPIERDESGPAAAGLNVKNMWQ